MIQFGFIACKMIFKRWSRGSNLVAFSDSGVCIAFKQITRLSLNLFFTIYWCCEFKTSPDWVYCRLFCRHLVIWNCWSKWEKKEVIRGCKCARLQNRYIDRIIYSHLMQMQATRFEQLHTMAYINYGAANCITF